MSAVTVVDYRPAPGLDAELAELGYASVRGWPDQQPITPALVRSILRATSLTATTLALHRDEDGRLQGVAAVRWPATLDAPGRLWGPLVHPDARGGGVAGALLVAVTDIMASHPGVRVVTSAVPERRSEGWTLFERAGWPVSSTSHLLRCPLPATGAPTVAAVAHGSAALTVRPMRAGEYLDQALATLYAGARPAAGYAMARDTYARWTADARYTPDGLLLAESRGALVGAALVYPLQHVDPAEPAEALLNEVLTVNDLDPSTAAEVRAALVSAALEVGVRSGAAVARAIVDDPDLEKSLQAAGFEFVDRVRFYTVPAATPIPSAAAAGASILLT